MQLKAWKLWIWVKICINRISERKLTSLCTTWYRFRDNRDPSWYIPESSRPALRNCCTRFCIPFCRQNDSTMRSSWTQMYLLICITRHSLFLPKAESSDICRGHLRKIQLKCVVLHRNQEEVLQANMAALHLFLLFFEKNNCSSYVQFIVLSTIVFWVISTISFCLPRMFASCSFLVKENEKKDEDEWKFFRSIYNYSKEQERWCLKQV